MSRINLCIKQTFIQAVILWIYKSTQSTKIEFGFIMQCALRPSQPDIQATWSILFFAVTVNPSICHKYLCTLIKTYIKFKSKFVRLLILRTYCCQYICMYTYSPFDVNRHVTTFSVYHHFHVIYFCFSIQCILFAKYSKTFERETKEMMVIYQQKDRKTSHCLE